MRSAAEKVFGAFRKCVPDEENVDFGASDAALQDQEMAAPPGGSLCPVLPGSVVLAYDLPGVAAELKLSRELRWYLSRRDQAVERSVGSPGESRVRFPNLTSRRSFARTEWYDLRVHQKP